jgi:hypothetical protein
MIHPDSQKRGFGTILTQHCNAISDKTGGKPCKCYETRDDQCELVLEEFNV